MKNINDVKYRFDWKSVYLVPVMAFTISTISLVMLITFNQISKDEKTLKTENVVKNESNVIAYIL